jgi:hypothetical protein
MIRIRRQLGSRWFSDWLRAGGRVHRDQLPPRLVRALRRAAERELARQTSPWRYVRWAFWGICLGATAFLAVQRVMGWR